MARVAGDILLHIHIDTSCYLDAVQMQAYQALGSTSYRITTIAFHFSFHFSHASNIHRLSTVINNDHRIAHDHPSLYRRRFRPPSLLLGIAVPLASLLGPRAPAQGLLMRSSQEAAQASAWALRARWFAWASA